MARRIGRRVFRFAATAVAVLVGSGCRAAPDGAASDGATADRAVVSADKGRRASTEPLVVMAAASLHQAMPDLLRAFEDRERIRGTLVLGATGSLAAQLVNGAPADLFFSADEATVDRLITQGLLDRSTRTLFANGLLLLVTRRGVEPPRTLQELTLPRFAIIALANPDLAPYGAAAQRSLKAAGVWDALAERLVFGESVAGAWQLVQSGNADAAFVAQSVVPEGAAVGRLVLDPALYPPLRQAAAVAVASRHPAARDFLDFVRGPEGQAVLRRHGFAPPQ